MTNSVLVVVGAHRVVHMLVGDKCYYKCQRVRLPPIHHTGRLRFCSLPLCLFIRFFFVLKFILIVEVGDIPCGVFLLLFHHPEDRTADGRNAADQ